MKSNGFNPVEQEIAHVRQKILLSGVDVATDLDWQFLLAHWQGQKMDALTDAIKKTLGIQTKKHVAVQVGIPTVTGAGILAVVLQILQAVS